ncbi:MAG: NAD(P)H-dependent oxidoreductase [Flavobacteriaceae bacterium]
MKAIIVQGSARSNGNTNTVVKYFQRKFNSDFIDLKDKNIAHYNYDHHYENDNFIEIIETILKYDLIIFATPVYWYSMSGIMKTFFDRITDCLKTHKELGRALKGKFMAAISCGYKPMDTESFFIPFKNCAQYLGMVYLGDVHTWVESEKPTKEVIMKISDFATTLKNTKKVLTDKDVLCSV